MSDLYYLQEILVKSAEVIPEFKHKKRALILPSFYQLFRLINFSKEIGVEKISILPYHEWGRLKYKQLGKRYTLKIKPPDEEYLVTLQKIIENNGVKVTIGF